MAVQDLVVTWEDAYRKYTSAVGEDVPRTSRAVAGAWRELAACAELPWWLSAAVRSAVQAFEHQAESLATDVVGQGDSACADTVDDGLVDEDEEEHHVYHKVVLPSQQGTRKPCACAHIPTSPTHQQQPERFQQSATPWPDHATSCTN